MLPVLGATVLLARSLPFRAGPATRGRRFTGRLALMLPPEEPADADAVAAVAAGLVMLVGRTAVGGCGPVLP